MNKKIKIFFLTCTVVLMVLMGMTATAFAIEKAIDIADTEGYYIDISDVKEEKAAGSDTIYVTDTPVTITFYGEGLNRQSIYYLSDAKVDGSGFVWGENSEKVAFTVKKYYPSLESGDTFNELVKEPENIPYYLHGNYAVLTKPGYYSITGSMEASAGTTVIVQVTGNAASTPKEEPAPAPSNPVEPAVTVQATPTSSKVLVDGKAVAFEAYNINGSNYFKLRDIAQAVNGSAKNFEISWDAENNAISLTSAKAYTAVGGELAVAAKSAAAQAVSTTSRIYLNGVEVKLTAYNIGGNNYFKLRDIGSSIDFNVTWDASANTIGIDTSSAYTE